MGTHNTLGKAGEEAAVALLEQKEYTVLHRNWRMKHLELDIVAMKAGVLVVVEVKTRADNPLNEPEDAVNQQKVRRIVVATDAYVKQFGIDMPLRFDIISVVGSTPQEFVIKHFEDAFYPPMFGR